jgi:hypothetical protein
MEFQADVNKAIYRLRQQGILKLVVVKHTDYIVLKATDSDVSIPISLPYQLFSP